MHAVLSVLSPVVSSEATGDFAWNGRRASAHSLLVQHRGRPPVSPPHVTSSHDLSPSAASRRAERSVRAILLPLLVLLASSTSAADAAASQLLILRLPTSVAVLVLAAFGCFLAGVGLGLVVALRFLRAANTAASEYHRAQVARLLGASSSVHASVQEVLAIVHRRTQELQRLVAMLQQGGAQ